MRLAIIVLCLLQLSCKTGPKIVVCILDANNDALQCSKGDGQGFSIPIKQADGYIAVSPDDAKILLDYCGIKP